MIRYSTLKRISVGVFLAMALDQGSKFLAQSLSSVIINHGISFGLFTSNVLPFVLMGFLVGLCILFYQSLFKNFPFAFGLFVGSSVSNLLDRFVYMGVRDFLPIPYTDITNNVADWLIVGSLLYMLMMSMRKKETI